MEDITNGLIKLLIGKLRNLYYNSDFTRTIKLRSMSWAEDLAENPEEQSYLEDIGIDGDVIKMGLKETVFQVFELINLTQYINKIRCLKYCNEFLRFIKEGKILKA